VKLVHLVDFITKKSSSTSTSGQGQIITYLQLGYDEVRLSLHQVMTKNTAILEADVTNSVKCPTCANTQS